MYQIMLKIFQNNPLN